MSSKGNQDFDSILKKIARAIYKREDVETLGKALNFDDGDIGRRIDSNALQGGSYMGTLDMLRDWRKGQRPTEEWGNLKRALESAGFRQLVGIHLNDDRTELPREQEPAAGTSQSSMGPEIHGNVHPDEDGLFKQSMKQANPTKDQLDPKKNYKMDVFHKGYMFIFNMKEARPGSYFDVENTEHVFEEIGYEIEKHTDMTAAELKKKLQEFVNSKRHKGMCSTVLMLMGHGTKTGIKCSCGQEVTFDYVKDLVSGMQSMTGNPKMIFFQSCRGREHAEEVQTDEIEADMAVPAKSDILIAHATTEGNVSRRDPKKGSWFIRTLCGTLLEHAHERDLCSMLEQVTGKVGEMVYVKPNEKSETKCRQCAVVVKQGVSKKIYFLPKYPPQDA